MEVRFDGKVALVTGATRGIGKKIAEDLESLGAKVIGFGSEEVDLSKAKDLNKFLINLEKENAHIDICINNAGIIFPEKITDFSEYSYDLLMDINLRAPFVISSAVGRMMLESGYGRIINIASIAANRVREGRSLYSASKHALVGLTKNLAVELGPYGVLSNTVSPGFTKTEMTDSMLTEEEQSDLLKQIPVQRLATTQDISNTVLFLASDKNNYINGQDIVVDGGFLNAVY